MRGDLPTKQNVVPIGSREWLESLRHGQELDRHNEPPLASQPVTDKLPTTMRQFMRDIGQRGRLERSRNYARRNVRGWLRFRRLYQCDPGKVKAEPVKASTEVRRHLRTCASLGGQERARRYPAEVRSAWAAKGGRARAAKRKQASSPAQAVAGKHGQPG